MSEYTANQCSNTNGANSNDNHHERQQFNFIVQGISQNGQAQEHGHTNGAELSVQNIPPMPASSNYTPNINTNGFNRMNMMNGINHQVPFNAQRPTFHENNGQFNGSCSVHSAQATNSVNNYNLMGYPNNPSWYPNPSMHHSPPEHVYPTGLANGRPSGQNKQKRIRTAFTTQQITILEREYLTKRYLERERRLVLAHDLSLNERTIKIWFQNRRMKEKKDRTANDASVSSLSSPGFPNMMSPSDIMNQPYAYNLPPQHSLSHSPPSLPPPPPSFPPAPSPIPTPIILPNHTHTMSAPINSPNHNMSSAGPSSSMTQAHFSGHQSFSGCVTDVPPQVQPTPEIPQVPSTSTTSWDLSWLKEINTDDLLD